VFLSCIAIAMEGKKMKSGSGYHNLQPRIMFNHTPLWSGFFMSVPFLFSFDYALFSYIPIVFVANLYLLVVNYLIIN
jgi:hypothetical protein